MSFRRTIRKRRSRRKPRRVMRRHQARNNKITTLRLRGVTGFPDQMFTSMKYVETIEFGAIGFHVQEFAGNKVSDPNVTGAGHQPMYFDEYSQLYNRWLAYSCSLRMEIVNSSTVPLNVVVFPSSTQVPILNISKAQEQPHARSTLVGNFGTNRGVLTHNMTTRKIRGETIMDDDFSGQGNSGQPSRQWFWLVVLESEPATTAVNCVIKFTLVYRVRWFKRVVAEQS